MKTGRKQTLALALTVAMSAVSMYAAVIERVIVRQQWPWEGNIKVEYRISGVSSPTDVQVSLSSGDTPVTLSPGAVKGVLYAVPADGVYSFTVDPSRTSLASVSRLTDLRVSLDPVAASESSLFPLYKIYDLETGECEDVSAGEIASGFRGEWCFAHEGSADLTPGTANPAALTNIVWTGFNSDDRYKTTKLVMRHVAAKTATVNLLNRKDRPGNIGYDYYIGVYEVTQKQWELVNGSASGSSWSHDMKPVNNVSYDSIRGADVTNYWSASVGGNAPHPDSFLGKLRTLTGGAPFDLPTRAMFEYASQANSLWRFANNGKNEGICAQSGWNDDSPFVTCPLSDSTKDPNLPGTYKGNAGSAGPAVVGSFACNKLGVYDTIGNVLEWCVDWHDGNVRQSDYTDCGGAANVDPSDPKLVWKNNIDDKNGYKRFRAGTSYGSSLSDGMTPNYTQSGAGVSPSTENEATGLRLVTVIADSE